MIQKFVDAFMARKSTLEAQFRMEHPGSYLDIVRSVVSLVGGNELDPERIHQIDDGDYQGTLCFVIAEKGCQPSSYWAVLVSYGSCSGCDTLQSIQDYGNGTASPTDVQVGQYMTLALHIVQGLRAI